MAAKIGRKELDGAKAHLPSGRVAVEEFVELLIEVFGIKNRRADWKTTLEEMAKAFFSNASWGGRR
jgi:hypothetical protein